MFPVAALTVSTRWRMRIYGLLDTHCAAARYVSDGNAHRICRHVDTVSAATGYVFDRREMRERGDLSDERREINKENRIGRHEDATNRRGSVLPYAMINNNSINNLKTKES